MTCAVTDRSRRRRFDLPAIITIIIIVSDNTITCSSIAIVCAIFAVLTQPIAGICAAAPATPHDVLIVANTVGWTRTGTMRLEEGEDSQLAVNREDSMTEEASNRREEDKE